MKLRLSGLCCAFGGNVRPSRRLRDNSQVRLVGLPEIPALRVHLQAQFPDPVLCIHRFFHAKPTILCAILQGNPLPAALRIQSTLLRDLQNPLSNGSRSPLPEAPRITAQELMDAGEAFTIIDVRNPLAWGSPIS